MDEEKISLPTWLPWATTACLAALVACLGELWVIEKAKSRLAEDELAIEQTALRASQNDLEAERIVSRREIAELRAAGEVSPAAGTWFLARGGDPAALSDRSQPWAVGAVLGDGRQAAVLCFGLPAEPAGRDYQVWLDGPPPLPVAAPAFHALEAEAARLFRVELVKPGASITRILIVDGRKGGAATLREALSAGSIILATPPQAPSISKR